MAHGDFYPAFNLKKEHLMNSPWAVPLMHRNKHAVHRLRDVYSGSKAAVRSEALISALATTAHIAALLRERQNNLQLLL